MKSQKDKQGQLSVVCQMVRTFPNVVASELLVAASVVLGEYWSLFFLGRFIDFVVSRATLTLLLKELLIFLVGLLGFALLKAIAKAVAASATDDLDAGVTKQMTKSLIDVDYSTFVSSDFRDLYSAAKNGMTFNGGFQFY
ncbi:hypothetical protein [Lacticaseibacillus suibinensis]|uniref:hypothetical protein n=1 Tax=Lacticaseibacillus suibinensis TaxID=2486011 RepID=UPI001941AD95|nr:hypothetical protein [Lacticaseibacillus suibinensis]